MSVWMVTCLFMWPCEVLANNSKSWNNSQQPLGELYQSERWATNRDEQTVTNQGDWSLHHPKTSVNKFSAKYKIFLHFFFFFWKPNQTNRSLQKSKKVTKTGQESSHDQSHEWKLIRAVTTWVRTCMNNNKLTFSKRKRFGFKKKNLLYINQTSKKWPPVEWQSKTIRLFTGKLMLSVRALLTEEDMLSLPP